MIATIDRIKLKLGTYSSPKMIHLVSTCILCIYWLEPTNTLFNGIRSCKKTNILINNIMKDNDRFSIIDIYIFISGPIANSSENIIT